MRYAIEEFRAVREISGPIEATACRKYEKAYRKAGKYVVADDYRQVADFVESNGVHRFPRYDDWRRFA